MRPRNRLLSIVAGATVSSLVLLSCETLVAPALGSGLLSLTTQGASFPADGASTTGVFVQVDTALAPARWVVTVSTTAGAFLPDGMRSVTTAADSTGHATVYLQAPRDSGVAVVTAYLGSTVGGLTRSDTVVYRRAAPDGVVLVLTDLYLRSGSSIPITARAYRLSGRPSPGVGVKFSARDGAGNAIGSFTTPLPTDTSDLVKVVYATGDSLYRGPIVISAALSADTSKFDRVTVTARP